MKRRIRKIVNFFAFNLLFFALYLNFIHKDNVTVETAPAASISKPAPSPGYAEAVLVQNPEKYLAKEEEPDQLKKN